MKVAIYAGEEFIRLDLFQDENISLTSKLSDIEKLSNVFTDFSNSFTIPASPKNNEVFKHYYDIDIDNTFNANIRIPAYVEIDTLPFRFGAMQLDGVLVTNHQPSHYKVTFYGDVSQLTERFGDDELSQLDYETINGVQVKSFSGLSKFDYDYNLTNFNDSMEDPSFFDGDVITPLINYSSKDWNYGGGNGVSVKDISIDAGAIDDVDLRPALRVIRIIEAIEQKYGITFSRDFFGKASFLDLFMWLNNKKDGIISEPIEFNITQPFTGSTNNLISLNGNQVEIKVRKSSIPSISSTLPRVIYYSNVDYFINVSDPNLTYDAKIVDENDNVLVESLNLSGNKKIGKKTTSPFELNASNELITNKYRLFITPHYSQDFTVRVEATSVKLTDTFSGLFPEVLAAGTSTPNISTLQVNMLTKDNIPKMKVIDFITSIMKMFKLIIRPVTPNDFYIDTLDLYYSKGTILDVTDYTDQESVQIDRPTIYSTINFNFEKTNNFLGQKFRENENPITEVGYGDLKAIYPSVQNKDTLDVKVGFENMLFENISDFTGETLNITTGFAASSTDNGETFTPNLGKPILFYNNGINNHVDYPIKVKFKTSGVRQFVYTYNIGNTNNEYITQVTDAINFGVELDQWHQQEIQTTLFQNYWSDWINTIYDLKQRKINYKGHFPERFIQELSLNDRLIIGDQRYKINDYTLNLVTQEVELNLFKDIYDAYQPISMNPMVLSAATYITDWTATASGDGVYLYGSQLPGRLTQVNFDGSRNTNFIVGTGFNANSFGFQSLLRDGNKLLVTGDFQSYNGTSRNRLIRLNENGSIDSTFNIGTGFNSYSLKSLKTPNDKYMIVGNFSLYSGVTNNRIVSLNNDGTIFSGFTAGTGFNNTAVDIVQDENNDLYVSGYFTTYSGVSRTRIIKLSSSGTVITAFNGGTGPNTGSAQPNGLIYNSNGLYMYGVLTAYSGVSVGRICKINQTTGALDPDFNVGQTGFTSTVFNAKTIYGNKILCSGSMSGYNGTQIFGHVILNGDGSLYHVLPSGFTYVYNIGNNIYGVNSTGNISLISEFEQDNISNEYILTNAGVKHYDFRITSTKSWVINKINTGDGTDWVDILDNSSGTGGAVVTLRVEEKASQVGPEVYEPRSMRLQVLYNDGSSRFITINQLGLLL
jgi:hypothetical protein